MITCDVFNTSAGNAVDFDSRPTLLIPISEPPLKRIIRTFFESGIHEAICEARNDRTAVESPRIKSAADLAHRIAEVFYNIKTKIIPGLKEKGPGAIAAYSETRDWINSNIRYISWHPNCFKLAVAGSDDVIRIYNDSISLPSLKVCFSLRFLRKTSLELIFFSVKHPEMDYIDGMETFHCFRAGSWLSKRYLLLDNRQHYVQQTDGLWNRAKIVSFFFLSIGFQAPNTVHLFFI